MDLIAEYNKKYGVFREITGIAMKVHNYIITCVNCDLWK
jgi:hypothetical protein